jgi:rubredoxin-NAD+ reductase
MRKWECIVCGLIYDEAKGWPDDGIAPGTRWEDVPEDWLCPDCGVGKEDFELIDDGSGGEEESAPHHRTPPAAQPAPVVIIGTGLAGYGLAREFRKHDSETPLLLITEDDGRAYSKPMLSTGYTKNTDADALTQNDAGTMARALGSCSVWTMTRVQAVDAARKMLRLADRDSEVHYRDLVLATGASVIEPPLTGDALERVYSVNDLMDYDDFRKAMQRLAVRRVTIIGAGLIGCEFTNDLLNGGFEVDVVDPMAYCLPTLLPEPCGRAVQAGLEERGARFHFGPLVTAVNYVDDAREGVRVSLNNGATIDTDLVVSAVGVRPRLDLAQAAGLATKRGIITDRYLKTSADSVYALGDCAEVAGHVLVYVAPLMAAARALGRTLAGEPTAVKYPAMPVTIKTPACPTVVAPPPAGMAGSWSFDGEGQDIRGEFRDGGGALYGFALTGAAVKEKIALQKQLPPILD